MNNKWNFKIELKDDGVFDKLKEYYGEVIPEQLKRLIKEANASNPEKNLIKYSGTELVFQTVLSYNETEEEAVTVFDVMKSVSKSDAIPFGMDPFGNVFYCTLRDSKVLFYDHEMDEYEDLGCNLDAFLNGLYAD